MKDHRQIGEPRLDTGLILEEVERRPRFNPLAPMLPEEVCWILDRAFTYEVMNLVKAPERTRLTTTTWPDGMARREPTLT